jgi:urea transporter
MGILLGTAVYSPALAAYAIVGSAVGTATGYLAMNAPSTELVSGLWGYNSALTAMGIGVFFQNTTTTTTAAPQSSQYYLLLIGSSSATAVVFGACKYVFGDVLLTPCLTLPFCITMSATWYLGRSKTINGLELAQNPHSPEKNK